MVQSISGQGGVTIGLDATKFKLQHKCNDKVNKLVEIKLLHPNVLKVKYDPPWLSYSSVSPAHIGKVTRKRLQEKDEHGKHARGHKEQSHNSRDDVTLMSIIKVLDP